MIVKKMTGVARPPYCFCIGRTAKRAKLP